MFTLTINTSSAAFEDANASHEEIGRLLCKTAMKLQEYTDDYDPITLTLFDTNGNRCGSAVLTQEG